MSALQCIITYFRVNVRCMWLEFIFFFDFIGINFFNIFWNVWQTKKIDTVMYYFLLEVPEIFLITI